MAAPPNNDAPDEDWVTYLATGLDYEYRQLKPYSDEYQMIAPRLYMHPEILREVGDRMAQVIVAWPELVVDSLEERLDVEGFRLPGEDAGDADLWRVWQANDCDEGSQMGHLDALVMGHSYISVGTNPEDADTPLIRYESPLQVYAEKDLYTGQIRAALRRWSDDAIQYGWMGGVMYPGAVTGMVTNYATLYLPDHTSHYQMSGGKWQLVDRDDHKLGVVPLVPLVHKATLANWRGRSVLHKILPLSHAANKIATDMMVAGEFVAIPLRGLFGVGPEDLVDENGNPLTAMQAIMGRLMLLKDADGSAKTFEFASAQLSNFTTVLNQLAQIVASIAGLPPHFLGMTTDNPASADAIRSSENRLIKRAERCHRPFGGSHETAARLVRRFQTGEFDPALKALETIWRDPSTPTVAQMADAATKKYQAGVITLRQAREDCRYTDAQIKRMEAEDETDRQALKMATVEELLEPLRSPRVTSAAASAAGDTTASRQPQLTGAAVAAAGGNGSAAG